MKHKEWILLIGIALFLYWRKVQATAAISVAGAGNIGVNATGSLGTGTTTSVGNMAPTYFGPIEVVN